MDKIDSGLTQPTPEQVRDMTVQVPNLPVLYFNHSRIVSSNFDLRIFLGQGNITAQGQQTLVEQLCMVMTPEFAAVFVETLKLTLEKFEERFGKIRQAPTEAIATLPAALPAKEQPPVKPSKKPKN